MKNETLWDRILELGFNIVDCFTEHPHSKGQSYFNHLLNALGYTILLVVACVFLVIHAFFPFLFKNVPSTIIEDVIDRIKGR